MLGIGAAIAQSGGDAADRYQVVKVFDAAVRYPPPSWVPDDADAKTIAGQSEQFREQQGGQFILEHVPKGETLENWSRMYAIQGLHLDAQAPDLPLEVFVKLTADTFAKICGGPNILVNVRGRQTDTLTAIFICANSPDGPRELGYGDGVGEVGLFRFIKFEDTLLRVYQEWRGAKFDLGDEASWPVNQTELDMMVERFRAIAVAPAR
jgi:hypothetical protein